jgi:hypothetical protein
MKRLLGALSYLGVVIALIAGTILNLLSVEPKAGLSSIPPVEASAVNRADDGHKADLNRVPVWIVPTTKYQFEAAAVTDSRKRIVISPEAVTSMAMRKEGLKARKAIDGATRGKASPGQALGVARSRDNDPFYRD